MELDDLKTAWRELDRRLDRNHALNLRVLKELKLDGTRSALRGLARLLVFELAVSVVAVLLVGSFLADHLGEPAFAVSAVVLHAVSLFMIVAAARQLAWIDRIDYSASVAAIQRDLARLRASRVRTVRWLLLLSPLLWTPLAIVAAQGLLDVDLYRDFGIAWVAANLAFGAAFIPLAVWIARRCGGWLDASPALRRLVDDVAGRSLVRAKDLVDEIARFEEEV
jgi:serine/threonine-protein kinase